MRGVNGRPVGRRRARRAVLPRRAQAGRSGHRLARQTARSAEVTHTHREGVAGAVAVALAAVYASRQLAGAELLAAVLDQVGAERVRRGIGRARKLLGHSAAETAYELGNGSQVIAQDTVPFCLWVAATYGDDYPGAVTCCIQAGGDIDTTCAIVGGIVAARTGSSGIPQAWLAAREPLPDWAASPG